MEGYFFGILFSVWGILIAFMFLCFFAVFSFQVFFFSLLLCFSAFLLLCFSTVLLLCFLLFCFFPLLASSAFLLLHCSASLLFSVFLLLNPK